MGGLKILTEALIKHGKTLFALSMSEFGAIGFTDTEQRAQWYTLPLTVEEAVAKAPWLKTEKQNEQGTMFPLIAKVEGVWTLRAPFDAPRVLRTDTPAVENNSSLLEIAKMQNVIFLREVLDVQSIGWGIEMFGKQHPHVVGQALDTITDVWDQLVEMKDPDPKKDRLAWQGPKRLNRRLLWATRVGGGHAVITTHLKPEYEKKEGELVKVGMIGANERATPKWADVHLRLFLPDETPENPFPRPKAGIISEGTMGMVRKGEIIEDVTFGKILRRVKNIPEITRAKLQGPAESEYRTAAALRTIEGAAQVAVDREDPVAPGRA